MLVPMPSWRAVSMAMAVSSPVIIFTATPLASTASIVAFESSRGGSNIGRMPSSAQVLPPSSERATRERAVALGGERGDRVLDLLRDVGRRLREVDDRLRRALGDGQRLALRRRVTVASVRLVTGSNGHEGGLRPAPWCAFGSFSALDHAGVDRVVVLEPRGERAGEHARPAGRWRRTGSGRRASAGSWSACRSCRCRGCRRPAISSIAASRETIAFCFESASAPSAMVIENTAGIATGIEATSRISTNCRMLERVVPAPVVGDDDVAVDLRRRP